VGERHVQLTSSGGGGSSKSIAASLRDPKKYLQGVADAHGTGSGKTARSVLSNIIGLAVRHKVLPFNSMREVRPAKASTAKATERDTTRALTRAERDHVLAVADEHVPAQHTDVSDLVWWLAGSGVRIIEALDQSWADLDLETGLVLARATKSASSTRTLALPPWLVARMRSTAEQIGTDGLVFRSPGTLVTDRARDRRNVARVFRGVLMRPVLLGLLPTRCGER